MTALQLLASALSISSVALEPTIQAAAIVVPLLAVILVIMWTRNRATQAAALLIVLAAASAQFAPAARAHDPGQGPEVTTAEMSVLPGENGTMTIHIGRFADGTGSGVQPTRVLARRAGKTAAGPLRREGDGFAGSLDVPNDGLWLVYGELRVGDRPVEIWLPVSSDGPVVTEVRPVYLPAGASERPAGEYLAGAALLLVGFGLLGWAAAAVRRSGRR